MEITRKIFGNLRVEGKPLDGFLQPFQDTRRETKYGHDVFTAETHNAAYVQEQLQAGIVATKNGEKLPDVFSGLTVKYAMPNQDGEVRSFCLPIALSGRSANEMLRALYNSPEGQQRFVVLQILRELDALRAESPLHPVGRLEGDLLPDTEVFHAVSNAIHKEVLHGTTILPLQTAIENSNGIVEQCSVGVPLSISSALTAALHMGILSPQQYTDAQKRIAAGGGSVRTVVRMRGYSDGKDGGASDDPRTSHYLLEGVTSIVEDLAAGREIEETRVVTFSPFQSGGYVPDRLVAVVKEREQAFKEYQGLLYQEAKIYKEALNQLGLISSRGTYRVDGDSRGALIAWRLAQECKELPIQLVLRNPVGFARGKDGGSEITLNSLLAENQQAAGRAEDRAARHRVLYEHGYIPRELDQSCKAVKLREQKELLTQCSFYTAPPNCDHVQVTFHADDHLAFPYEESAGINKEIVRQEIMSQFSNAGAEVVLLSGTHTTPPLSDTESFQEMQWCNGIVAAAPWLDSGRQGLHVDVYPTGQPERILLSLQEQATRSSAQ